MKSLVNDSKSDLDVVKAVLDGDKESYSILVDRYKIKGMSLAFRILNNREDAEDALQQAFIRAYKSLSTFEKKSTFATWFYRILYNVCIGNITRNKSKFFENIEDVQEIKIIDETDYTNIDELLSSNEFAEILNKEMEKLEPIYSTILTLFYVQELSYTEIVTITGLPIGTIKNRLFRARTLLKKALIKYSKELI
jgi:RNA polymerase sigma-70 factor (ECF subfamily)